MAALCTSEAELLGGESALSGTRRIMPVLTVPAASRFRRRSSGVEFYKANGFEEVSRGAADLLSGQSMPCVFMRKLLR